MIFERDTSNKKTCQTRLLSLTHNLMTLTEKLIFRETSIRNETEIKRIRVRLVSKWLVFSDLDKNNLDKSFTR